MPKAIAILATLTRLTHKVEYCLECPLFEDVPTVQIALSQVRIARMYGGDCLRMFVNANDPRSAVRFDPAEHGARHIEPIDFDGATEIIIIQTLKKELRSILYQLLDNVTIALEANSLFCHSCGMIVYDESPNYLDEFFCYRNEFIRHLKEADQLLGLRIGEIYNKK